MEDQALIEALAPYGDIKGEVIQLKYNADHDLTGLEPPQFFELEKSCLCASLLTLL